MVLMGVATLRRGRLMSTVRDAGGSGLSVARSATPRSWIVAPSRSHEDLRPDRAGLGLGGCVAPSAVDAVRWSDGGLAGNAEGGADGGLAPLNCAATSAKRVVQRSWWARCNWRAGFGRSRPASVADSSTHLARPEPSSSPAPVVAPGQACRHGARQAALGDPPARPDRRHPEVPDNARMVNAAHARPAPAEMRKGWHGRRPQQNLR